MHIAHAHIHILHAPDCSLHRQQLWEGEGLGVFFFLNRRLRNCINAHVTNS